VAVRGRRGGIPAVRGGWFLGFNPRVMIVAEVGVWISGRRFVVLCPGGFAFCVLGGRLGFIGFGFFPFRRG